MKNLTLNFDKFKLATIFLYKGNRHIVVWEKRYWIFTVNVDEDPEFNFCWDSFINFIYYNDIIFNHNGD